METTTRTRYGRVVKKPERYEPQEVVEDDFSDSELESDWEEDISSEVSYDSEELEEESEDDDSFVASDDDEKNEESDNNGSDDDTSDEDADSDSDAESVGSSDTAPI